MLPLAHFRSTCGPFARRPWPRPPSPAVVAAPPLAGPTRKPHQSRWLRPGPRFLPLLHRRHGPRPPQRCSASPPTSLRGLLLTRLSWTKFFFLACWLACRCSWYYLCHQIFEYMPPRGMLQILLAFWPFYSAFTRFRAQSVPVYILECTYYLCLVLYKGVVLTHIFFYYYRLGWIYIIFLSSCVS